MTGNTIDPTRMLSGGRRTTPPGSWVQVSTLEPYNVYRGVVAEYRDLDEAGTPGIVLAQAEIRGRQAGPGTEEGLDDTEWIPLRGTVAVRYHDNTLAVLWRPGWTCGPTPAAVLAARAEGAIQ